MSFTVVESSIGAALLGASICAHLQFNGRISGMSGVLAGALKINSRDSEWEIKIFYLFGLFVGGWILNMVPAFAGQAFNPSISIASLNTFQWILFPIAGILVGFGTQMGSGCTSGHMLCGVARLSERSFVAMSTFCATCLIWVKLLNSRALISGFYGLKVDPFGLSFPSFTTAVYMFGVLLIVLVIYFLIFMLQPVQKVGVVKKENTNFTSGLAFLNALVFALGLGFSGMTKPQKVLGFFDFGPNWDPSLCCVMLFAMAPSIFIFQGFILKNQKNGMMPMFGEKWWLPTTSKITIPLILGSIIFGSGWGMLGFCPGPLLVGLSKGGFESVLLAGFTIIGIMLYNLYDSTIQKVLPHDK